MGSEMCIRDSGKVAHQLFRLGTVETLASGLENDGLVLLFVLTLEGVAQNHLHLAQTIHQAA